ncbi:nuclear transport factor 2 family protein [Nocardia vaccinii]|uniref:nuclear transport factor 2 family protein n=1 Tax=Nocardia vaccinii TaxID=1822 RepID=UPI000832A5D5|nr:nuclear transport factor 2 family protein [Nocardia vaccinii]
MGTQQSRATVERYVELVASGTAAQILELYAPEAVVEDPIGSEPRRGLEAIRELYAVLEPLQRKAEATTIRVSGNHAAVAFTMVSEGHGHRMTISPVDIMEFDDEGRILSMRAYWSQDDLQVEQL